jgi:GNAT superfamily N-acetyltransferase
MQKASAHSMEATFIPATTDHLSHIIMLAHRIWPVAYENILTPEQIDNMLLRIYSRDNLEKEIQNGHQFWLSYLGEKPVAYASAYKDDDVIWIRKLYVEPQMQGKRIGVKLMHTVVSELLPAHELRLLTNANNTPAHKFYEHLGFSKIGEVPVKMGDWDFNDFLFSMPLITQ